MQLFLDYDSYTRSSISIGDKLEIVILTNIGLLSGTIAVIYSINKEH